MDLGNFKSVNDALGHDAGDLLLKEVGERITPLLPENAVLARVGGDEFVADYPKTEDENKIQQLAQKLTQQLALPFTLDDHVIQISFSLGAAQFPHQANSRSALLKAADSAMYQAKHAGKGQYCVYVPTNTDLNQKVAAA